jgi:nucleoside-diphosphate-sugar epimerase
MDGKKIVVTGGGGFIGSNIVKHLMTQNEVIVLDDFSTGRRENIQGIENEITLVEGSITDIDLVQRTFRDVDYVLHQAALPSVPRSIDDPITSNMVNVNGTLNVLTAAKDNNVEKVVFAASSSAYGDTPTLPKVETMPVHPLSPYAVTKVTCEQYMRIFNDIYGLRTTALRYFNVFGPSQDPTSQYSAVIPKFVRAVINDESPTIYGNGEQSRDFTFVKDTIQANIKAAESTKADGHVINIAKGDRTTVNDLANMIIDYFGKTGKIELSYVPEKPGDVKHSLADITMARELMGFEPKYTLEDGLNETLEYFKEYYGV